MTDEELLFCTLCAPLADAIDLIDSGEPECARALLQRLLRRAEEISKKGTGINRRTGE